MPRPRSRSLFELGGQWIATEGDGRNLYRYWFDSGTGRTRRESLRTADLESAKRALAEIVIKGAPKTSSARLSVVLEEYFVEHTDKLPSKLQSRNAGKVLLRHFGETARIESLTEAKQKEFATKCIEEGCRLSYIARNLVVLRAALAHARIVHEVIYTEAQMERRWGLRPAVVEKARIPTDEEIAALWSVDLAEDLRRFILIQLATGGRPQTALDLMPQQRIRDASLVDLNPPTRAQNKKRRPILREPRVLTGWLDKWEAEKAGLETRRGHYCGYTTIEGVKSGLERAVDRAGIAKISTYSFRHKVTTVLRQARVPEDEIARQLGHRRSDLRTTAGYGEWDPGYLANAAAAIDAWFARVQKLTTRPLFSQGFPKTVRRRREKDPQVLDSTGAGEANRTPDPNLGKFPRRLIRLYYRIRHCTLRPYSHLILLEHSTSSDILLLSGDFRSTASPVLPRRMLQSGEAEFEKHKQFEGLNGKTAQTRCGRASPPR
jgi:integrase